MGQLWGINIAKQPLNRLVFVFGFTGPYECSIVHRAEFVGVDFVESDRDYYYIEGRWEVSGVVARRWLAALSYTGTRSANQWQLDVFATPAAEQTGILLRRELVEVDPSIQLYSARIRVSAGTLSEGEYRMTVYLHINPMWEPVAQPIMGFIRLIQVGSSV